MSSAISDGKAAGLVRKLWQARSVSERRTLSLAGVILLVFICYAWFYEPWQQQQSQMRVQLQEQAQAIALAKAAIAKRGPNIKTVNTDERSVLAIVDQAIRSANLQSGLKNISPGDANSVRIELAGVNFAQLAQTLEKLEDEQKFVVFEMQIDAISNGIVNAKLSLRKDQ